jgi:heat shock protein HslJ
MKQLFAGSVLVFLILGACMHSAGIVSVPVPLEGETWLLQEFDGRTAPFPTVDQVPYIQFGTEKRQFNGFAGCNLFFGEYCTADDGSLSLGPTGSTRRYCAEAEWEHMFFLALECTVSYRIEGEELQLLNENDEVLVRFLRGK